MIGLLQPAPETYDLFDDVILIATGKVTEQEEDVEYLTDTGAGRAESLLPAFNSTLHFLLSISADLLPWPAGPGAAAV